MRGRWWYSTSKASSGNRPRSFDLPLGAEVDHRRQAEVGQLGTVVFVEPGEAVGAKELPPTDAAPVGARISTEVTEVDTPRQGEFAEWLSERRRSRNREYRSCQRESTVDIERVATDQSPTGIFDTSSSGLGDGPLPTLSWVTGM